MSTSKGRGAAAHTMAEVVPPEQLRFLFLRPRPNHAIDFDPDGTDQIPRLFDEFDKFAAATAGREVKGELPPGFEATFRYSLLDPDADVAAEAAAFRPAFDHLAHARPDPGRRRRRAGRGGEGECPDRPRDRDPRRARRRRPAPGSTTYAPERARRPRPRRALPAAAAELDDDAARVPGDLADVRRRGAGRRRRRLAGAIFVVARERGAAGRPGVRCDLPRVPRSAERAACRLAAGQPRSGVRRRRGCARPPMRTGREVSHERRPAAAARGARRHPPGRHRQGRGPGARRPRARARRPTARSCSARARRSRRSATPPSKRIGEAIKGGADAGRPRGRRAQGGVGRGRRADHGRSTPSWPTVEAAARRPAPADPQPGRPGRARSAARRPTSRSGRGASCSPTRSRSRARSAPTRRPAARPGRAGRTGSSARRSTSSTTPRGAKIAGSGFPVYKGAGSALQRGLINWFLDVHTREHGFTEVWPPAVVNTASATGTGQIPDKEDQMYVVTRDELYLVPTAEVPVTNLHRDEILDADRAADPLRGLHAVLPARGRRRRQGHPRDPARPPVRQGRDGPVRAAGGLAGRARVDDRARRDPPPAPRAGLPGPADEHARDGLRPGQQVRPRGLVAGRRALARGQLVLELPRLPGAPDGHPLPTRSRAPSPSSCTRSTVAAWPWPGSSPRSSRPTSSRTARSPCRTCCGPTSVARSSRARLSRPARSRRRTTAECHGPLRRADPRGRRRSAPPSTASRAPRRPSRADGSAPDRVAERDHGRSPATTVSRRTRARPSGRPASVAT